MIDDSLIQNLSVLKHVLPDQDLLAVELIQIEKLVIDYLPPPNILLCSRVIARYTCVSNSASSNAP